MKKHVSKLISAILALTMLLGLLPTAFITASAATTESYGISIAGVLVTDANKDDVLGDGAFSFSPDNNELFIYKAITITATSLLTTGAAILLSTPPRSTRRFPRAASSSTRARTSN